MFIVFEGIDGSGLTTQSHRLGAYFEKRGKKTFLTKEPTNNPIGKIIRDVLSGSHRIDQEALALLFAADRSEHMKDIKKNQDSVIVCDRYCFSNFAYQMLQVELGYLMEINSPFLKPDLTIFLDVPPRVCKKRIDENRDHIEIFEHEETLERIRENYLQIITLFEEKGYAITKVDGDRNMKDVHEAVVKSIKEFI
ncbi:MAG: dTMP kinase [Euryarchaeota archaeon]|nr:dTMP kinase [Euryarchaeota archaeon]